MSAFFGPASTWLRQQRRSGSPPATSSGGLTLISLLILAPLCLSAPAAHGQEIFFIDIGGSTPSRNPNRPFPEGGNPSKPVALIWLDGFLQTPATVSYRTEPITAREGQDYVGVEGSHTFPVDPILGRGLHPVWVDFIDDDRVEGDETFRLVIDVSGGATLAGRASAIITIVDDEEVTVSFDLPPGDEDESEAVIVAILFDQDGELLLTCPNGPLYPNVRLSQPFAEDVLVTVETVEGEPVHVDTALIEAGELTGSWTPRGEKATFLPSAPCEGFPYVVAIQSAVTQGEAPSQLSLGAPSRAKWVDCRVSIPGGGQRLCQSWSCALVFYRELACQASRIYCAGVIDVIPRVTSSFPPAYRGAAASADTLRQLRDDKMSASRAGRYYRDLYDVFSPELSRIVSRDPFVLWGLIRGEEPWLEALEAIVDERAGEVTITPSMIDDMEDLFDRFEDQANEEARELFVFERERLDFPSLVGDTMADFVERIEEQGGPPPCENGATSLCLLDQRFRVEVFWTDFAGESGRGEAVTLSSDSGAFWFFDDDNVELIVKVLDGTVINDRYWVFYGALTNVEFSLRVTDTLTGAVRSFENRAGTFASAGHTTAFDREGGRREESRSPGATPSLLARLQRAGRALLGRGARAINDRLRKTQRRSLQQGLLAASGGTSATGGSCAPGPLALCLNGNRFRVEVAWRDFSGGSGAGRPAPLTSDTGTFWFFDASNTELVVKVLDGTALNDRYWVFYGALSNVEYTITVTDTVSGAVRRYHNALGEFGSFGDTEAF